MKMQGDFQICISVPLKKRAIHALFYIISGKQMSNRYGNIKLDIFDHFQIFLISGTQKRKEGKARITNV